MKQNRGHFRGISPIIAALAAALSVASGTLAADTMPGETAASGAGAVAAAGAGAGAGAAAPMPATAPTALVRVTSSFEVSHAGAVLKQVAKLFRAGFLRQEAQQLAKDIELLPADQSHRWDFAVVYKSVSYPLQIRARLDEFGMLDLDFFCAPAAAEAVRSKVDGYLNSRGL